MATQMTCSCYVTQLRYVAKHTENCTLWGDKHHVLDSTNDNLAIHWEGPH